MPKSCTVPLQPGHHPEKVGHYHLFLSVPCPSTAAEAVNVDLFQTLGDAVDKVSNPLDEFAITNFFFVSRTDSKSSKMINIARPACLEMTLARDSSSIRLEIAETFHRPDVLSLEAPPPTYNKGRPKFNPSNQVRLETRLYFARSVKAFVDTYGGEATRRDVGKKTRRMTVLKLLRQAPISICLIAFPNAARIWDFAGILGVQIFHSKKEKQAVRRRRALLEELFVRTFEISFRNLYSGPQNVKAWNYDFVRMCLPGLDPYTLKPVTADDNEDEDSDEADPSTSSTSSTDDDAPAHDHQSNLIAAAITSYSIGKVCKANAHTAYNLQHYLFPRYACGSPTFLGVMTRLWRHRIAREYG